MHTFTKSQGGVGSVTRVSKSSDGLTGRQEELLARVS
jgi:hypothetical protein